MPFKPNLINQRFGRLLVIAEGLSQQHGRSVSAMWLCVCDCGNQKLVRTDGLRSGHTQSCGCLGAEKRKAASIAALLKHGASRVGKHTPTYRSWASMLNRTRNPRLDKWEYYGGREIPVTVCEHWEPNAGGSFANFLADMGERPEGQTLDKDHGPRQYWCPRCGGDVRWATWEEQAKNRRH